MEAGLAQWRRLSVAEFLNDLNGKLNSIFFWLSKERHHGNG